MNYLKGDKLQTNISPLFYEEFNIKPGLSYQFYDKIITKEFLREYKKLKGEEALEGWLNDFIQFTRIISPNFPYPGEKESLQYVINKLQQTPVNTIYNREELEFNNAVSSVGIPYLKAMFKNYFDCSYKTNKSPVDAYRDDKTLRRLIKYRVGLNNSNEVFDFSLHQIVRGISAAGRHTISFFKPTVAYVIYKHFLENKTSPKTIDPCAGFGGRMLGFAAAFPDGTYVGIEPSKETYNNLLKLREEIIKEIPTVKIELYNCKLEDYTGSKECDLAFTSIPYYDLENYNNNVKYEGFEEWKNTFIKGLLTFNNLVVNLPGDLQEKINLPVGVVYTLKNNVSHFNKSGKKKKELVVKTHSN